MGKVKFGVCTASAFLAVSLTCGAFGASADESIADKQQQLNELREENEKRQQEIDNLGGNISENEDAMALIGDQIDGYLNEIAVYGELVTAKQEAVEQNKAQIEEIENTIAQKEIDIENKRAKAVELKAENDANLEKFGKLARYMYMNNFSNQLPVLSGSDDWFDYFVYADVVQNVGRQNEEFMEQINSSIKEQENLIIQLNDEISSLETEKATLEQEKAELEQQEIDLENTKASLEASAEDRREKLNELASENDEYQDRIAGLKYNIAEAEAQAEAINKEIEELIRQAQENRDPDMPDYSGDGLRWPLDAQYHQIITGFGFDPWRGGNHGGVDIWGSGIHGANIYAAQSGVVTTTSFTCPHNEPKRNGLGYDGCGGGFGNYIIIDHGGSLATLYAHVEAIYVSAGDFVEKGDVIGAVGSTGWSTDYHLHFETRVNGTRVDPINYLPV